MQDIQNTQAKVGLDCHLAGSYARRAAPSVGGYNSPMTIISQFKMDAASTAGGYVGIGTNSAGACLRLYKTTTGYIFGDTSVTVASSAVNDADVHTVAGVYSVTTAQLATTNFGYSSLYIDGELKTVGTSALVVTYGTSDLSIGAVPAGTANNSKATHYRALFFNYALSEDKLRRYMDGGRIDWQDVGGSMCIFTDNGFDSAAAWTVSSTNWSVTGSAAVASNIPNGATIAPAALLQPVVAGKTYRVLFTIGTATNGDVQFTIGGVTGVARGTASSTYVQEVVALTSAAPLIQATGGAFTGTITKFIVTQLGALGAYEPEGLSGTQWADSSGNNQDLTITGATTINLPEVVAFKRGSSVPQYVEAAALADIQSAQKRTGLHCDGVSDYAASAATVNFAVGTGDVTMFFTISTDTSSPSTDRLMGYLSNGFQIHQKAGSLELQIRQATQTAQSTGLYLVKGQTHTCIFSRSNGKIRLYLDGKASADYTFAPVNPGTSATFNVAYADPTDAWLGSIYRAGLLNYALPEDKIRRYSAGERLDWEDLNGSMIANTVAADQTFTGADTGYWTRAGAQTPSYNVGSPGYIGFNVTTGGYIVRLHEAIVGKSYRLTFNVSQRTSGSVGLESLYATVSSVKFNGASMPLSQQADAVGSWEFEFVAKSIHAINLTTFAAVLQINSIIWGQLGALAAYEGENLLPSGGTTGLWPDSSGNNNDLTITGATTINLQDSLEIKDKLIVGGIAQIGSSAAGTAPLTISGSAASTGLLIKAGGSQVSYWAATASYAQVLYAANGSTILSHMSQTGDIRYLSPTDSTSAVTGALVVTGGVGIGGTLNVGGNSIRVATAKTPASSAATGTTGDICWDANYVYVCVATNTWKRSAIATW
jgi:hypothetical protein